MNLAIVGYSPTRDLIPFDDPDWHVWGMNECWTTLESRGYPIMQLKWDGFFQMHHEHVIDYTSPGCIDFIRTFITDCPVYMLEPCERIPNSTRYPIERMTEIYGDYWVTTPAYQVALAGSLGAYDEIRFFGINCVDDEQPGQRACIEHHAGIIKGKGGNVTADGASMLFRQGRRYGYEYDIQDFEPRFMYDPRYGARMEEGAGV